MRAYSLKTLYRRLLAQHGPQGWWPVLDRLSGTCLYHGGAPHDDDERFEIALGAILTQNVAWKNVEKALANLSHAGLLGAAALAATSTETIAECIRPTGYYNQKARKIRALLEWLAPVGFSLSSFQNWPTGDLRRVLLGIYGIGPETADSILLYALDRPVFVIDAYTRRIASRLGLITGDESYSVLQDLFQRGITVDRGSYREYHAFIVAHGKDVCASKPLCVLCSLAGCCAAARRV